MPLNWNITKVVDHENLCWVKDGDGHRVHPVTECLVFGTMGVGLGEITEANCDEFARRLAIYQELVGAMMVNDKGPRLITAEEVRAHIGLHTNVRNEKPAAWRKRMLDYVWLETCRNVRVPQTPVVAKKAAA